jgi:hypothetical protein
MLDGVQVVLGMLCCHACVRCADTAVLTLLCCVVVDVCAGGAEGLSACCQGSEGQCDTC